MENLKTQHLDTAWEEVALYELLKMGQITLEEFLQFSGLSFAPKLMEMVKNRLSKSSSG